MEIMKRYIFKIKTGLDMCYSMHFHKISINTPTNAQLPDTHHPICTTKNRTCD